MDTSDSFAKATVLDCNIMREFNFLIQVHDCSTPSLASRKIPVKIQVLDHDDYPLKFERDIYTQNLAESNGIYENFMSVRARDLDCTNFGYACSYKLLLNDLNEVNKNFPIQIDSNGSLSTVRSIKATKYLKFKVRAFDCVNKNSYVDTEVIIKVVKPCLPEYSDFATEITAKSTIAQLFPSVKVIWCHDETNSCLIKSLKSVIKLQMNDDLKEDCLIGKNTCQNQMFWFSSEIDSDTKSPHNTSFLSHEKSVYDRKKGSDADCKKTCEEYIEINMSGIEHLLVNSRVLR